MFPYKDENPTTTTPLVTVGIIILCAAVWVIVQGLGAPTSVAGSVCRFGVIPGELLGTVPPGTEIPLGRGLRCVIGDTPPWHTLVTSMFMHGGWFHLIGNMWFLWVFGNNIEDVMGHGRFIGFYLITGAAAAMAQVLASPSSAVPMVGASGAISGVMGGYLVLFPRVRVHTVVFLGFFVTTVAVPAYLMLGYWFLLQLVGSLPSLAGAAPGGGVAFLAHAGGFVAGVVLIRFFAREDRLGRKRHSEVWVRPRWR